MIGAGMNHILEIDDPYQRLLYAIVYESFWDFYYYRHDMSIRLPAFNFLISGGGEWKEHIKTNVLRDYIRFCKINYWGAEGASPEGK